MHASEGMLQAMNGTMPKPHSETVSRKQLAKMLAQVLHPNLKHANYVYTYICVIFIMIINIYKLHYENDCTYICKYFHSIICFYTDTALLDNLDHACN